MTVIRKDGLREDHMTFVLSAEARVARLVKKR